MPLRALDSMFIARKSQPRIEAWICAGRRPARVSGELAVKRAKGERVTMQYLVSMETIEPDPLPPEQLVGLSRQAVLPTHDALLELKAQGKILTLGVPVGSRTWLFVVDADSHKELDELLVGLPAWAITETKVTPLHILEERAENDRRFIERLESELQQ